MPPSSPAVSAEGTRITARCGTRGSKKMCAWSRPTSFTSPVAGFILLRRLGWLPSAGRALNTDLIRSSRRGRFLRPETARMDPSVWGELFQWVSARAGRVAR